jgi:hypothetical protein
VRQISLLTASNRIISDLWSSYARRTCKLRPCDSPGNSSVVWPTNFECLLTRISSKSWSKPRSSSCCTELSEPGGSSTTWFKRAKLREQSACDWAWIQLPERSCRSKTTTRNKQAGTNLQSASPQFSSLSSTALWFWSPQYWIDRARCYLCVADVGSRWILWSRKI